MQQLQRHPHVRMRKPAKPEPYPSRFFKIAIIDTMVYVVSIASPIFTLPQVYQIYAQGNAAGVSALSWGAYSLFAIPWLLYGIVHKERVIIFNNTLSIMLSASIFVGALMY